MSDPRFLQDGFSKRLSHFVEECGEALAAAGKTQRWGAWGWNPLIAPADRESNLIWLIRELADVRQAIDRLELSIQDEFLGPDCIESDEYKAAMITMRAGQENEQASS
jgi:hypothetical protein